MTPILSIRNLSFTYGAGTPFERRALDGVSLDIMPGEFLGVIGHTGSGKSTLIQHMNGLMKPQNGTVLFNGDDITGKKFNISRLRFRVGLVFQYPEYQLFEETVEKDIAFGPRNQGLSEDEIGARVREAMRTVGLSDDIGGESPFVLSGGQKRRVAVAGILAMKPDVLVLDEPTAGLDPGGRDEILAHIVKYRRDTGATVIFVTHSMEEIASHVERIAVMKKGRLDMLGTPREVFGQAGRLQADGLDIPQVTRVFSLLAVLDSRVDPAVYTVEQAVAQIQTLI